jgi:predicted nucleic acid-binding protein
VILLDTSVLIQPPEVWPDDSFGSSIISLAELHFGVNLARDEQARELRTRRLAVLRTTFEWMPFDEYAAQSYGILAATVWQSRPAHSRSKDIMIAAQAHALGVPLMTRNPKDFILLGHLVHVIAVPA